VSERSPAHVALGRAVRELRKARGLTQKQLGSLCDMHRTYIGGVERGERNPTFDIQLRLARALQVSLSELLVRAAAHLRQQ
jgi:transcriptional regulator with XRE-family HTH domain